MLAAEIRRMWVSRMRSYWNWQWHLDEVFVKIQGETCYLWQAVDHEGEVLESYVSKRRDRNAALKFFRKVMERYGGPEIVVTENLASSHETILRSKSTMPISLSGLTSVAHDE
jgi:putative transposase